MAIAPVHLATHGHGLGVVGIVVGVHVAGMFAPSPVSGRLADSLGPEPVAAAGFSLLVAAGVAGAVLDVNGASPMVAVLLTLGVGWNLAVVGGSTLLAASVPPRYARAQRASARSRWASPPGRARRWPA